MKAEVTDLRLVASVERAKRLRREFAHVPILPHCTSDELLPTAELAICFGYLILRILSTERVKKLAMLISRRC